MFKHLVIALAMIGGVGLATPQDAEAGPRDRRDRQGRNRVVRERDHSVRVAPRARQRIRQRVRQRSRARIRRIIARRRAFAARRFYVRRGPVFVFDGCRTIR